MGIIARQRDRILGSRATRPKSLAYAILRQSRVGNQCVTLWYAVIGSHTTTGVAVL